jgi:Heterokaryon incompatibility protein (HET)
MSIVIPVMPCRYLALSYVWGRNGENSFLALKNNIASLAEPRGLNIVLNLLPPTISDAITITRDLGERYLWVDSLCIVQDDAESKEENIASMPLVYKGSTLTLVAGTGDSAISGLAGVQSGSRVRSQHILTLGRDKKLALVDDIELLLVKSPWDSRGWTYVVLRNP